MQPNHLIFFHPLLLPSIFPSIRVFSSESAVLIRWPKCWSFSFSIGPSNEYSGLISFRIDWLDLLSVQGTQESSPTAQFKSINSSALCILCGPALTSIHDYWKEYSLWLNGPLLAKWCLCFLTHCLNLSWLSCQEATINHLPISWLQSLSTVILEPKRKSVPASTFSPCIYHEVMGLEAMSLVFLILSFRHNRQLQSNPVHAAVPAPSRAGAPRAGDWVWMLSLCENTWSTWRCNSSLMHFGKMRSGIRQASAISNEKLIFINWLVPLRKIFKRVKIW